MIKELEDRAMEFTQTQQPKQKGIFKNIRDQRDIKENYIHFIEFPEEREGQKTPSVEGNRHPDPGIPESSKKDEPKAIHTKTHIIKMSEVKDRPFKVARER